MEPLWSRSLLEQSALNLPTRLSSPETATMLEKSLHKMKKTLKNLHRATAATLKNLRRETTIHNLDLIHSSMRAQLARAQLVLIFLMKIFASRLGRSSAMIFVDRSSIVNEPAAVM